MVTQTAHERYTTTVKRDQIMDSLRDPEYRREFAADVGTGIAFQIRRLREDRGWTQADLARETGKRQETISLWENPDYGNYSLSTLRDLAAAFDVALLVKFAPFSELIDWTANLSPERLAPPSFDSEIGHTTTTLAAALSSVGVVVDTYAPLDDVFDQVQQSLAAVQHTFQAAIDSDDDMRSAIGKAPPTRENQYAKAA